MTNSHAFVYHLSILIWASYAASVPLDARVDPDPCTSGLPTFKVLAYENDQKPSQASGEFADQFCRQAQIPFIQGGIQVAQQLASEADQALSKPDAFQSEAVKTFLGRRTTPGISPKNILRWIGTNLLSVTAQILESLVQMRFKNVEQSLSGATLIQVDAVPASGKDESSVYFVCPPKCVGEDKDSLAFTINVADNIPITSISLCPAFFKQFNNGLNAQTGLAQSVADYKAQVSSNPNKMNTFNDPNSPGVLVRTSLRHSV